MPELITTRIMKEKGGYRLYAPTFKTVLGCPYDLIGRYAMSRFGSMARAKEVMDYHISLIEQIPVFVFDEPTQLRNWLGFKEFHSRDLSDIRLPPERNPNFIEINIRGYF